MRISDWSSDVCSSDLAAGTGIGTAASLAGQPRDSGWLSGSFAACTSITLTVRQGRGQGLAIHREVYAGVSFGGYDVLRGRISRSEEHTSETPVTNAHLVCRLLLEKKKSTKKCHFYDNNQ